MKHGPLCADGRCDSTAGKDRVAYELPQFQHTPGIMPLAPSAQLQRWLAQIHGVKLALSNLYDRLAWDAGSFYLMARGYLDFARLHRRQQSAAFFVTRAKMNFRCARRYSRPVDKTTGLRFDQTAVTAGHYTRRDYDKD